MKFVIQKHTHRDNPTHWDIMLQNGDRLTTYRVNIPPEKFSSSPIPAEKINDHSIKFLTYQGPVNNGLGTVEIADNGYCEIVQQKENELILKLTGKLLRGNYTIKSIASI